MYISMMRPNSIGVINRLLYIVGSTCSRTDINSYVVPTGLFHMHSGVEPFQGSLFLLGGPHPGA